MVLKVLFFLAILNLALSVPEPDPDQNIHINVEQVVNGGGCCPKPERPEPESPEPEPSYSELEVTELQNLDCTSYCDSLNDTVDLSRCEEIEFRLYNSKSDEYDKLITDDTSSLDYSSLNSSLPLLVVVHGYKEDADTAKWMHEIKNKTLEKTSTNVILVQWTKLANYDIAEYCQAVQNTRCVGTALANLLIFLQVPRILWTLEGVGGTTLQSYKGLSPADTHIIGFSLGAQLAGVTGFQLQNHSTPQTLSRITGLDPAGPGFYQVDLKWRLDKSDANFVDIIHTNGGCFSLLEGYFGFFNASGHVDFYVDGGQSQNGCTDESNILGCSHSRAHDYYVESLYTPDPKYGYLCADYDAFKNGSCMNNANNTVGYGVEIDPAGVFYSDSNA